MSNIQKSLNEKKIALEKKFSVNSDESQLVKELKKLEDDFSRLDHDIKLVCPNLDSQNYAVGYLSSFH